MKVINDYKKKIDNELKAFFKMKKAHAKKISKDVYNCVNILEDFTLRGGKKLRPLLTVFGYTGYGGKDTKEIVKASIATELVHSFLLIHDDIIDNDDLRRGGPTAHKVFDKKYDHSLGESLAIILGDISFCYALEPLLESSFDNDKKIKALRRLTAVVERTCYGEFFDVIGEVMDVDEKFIRDIHLYKTANYTIAGPLTVGAILAGASEEQIKDLIKLGIKIGLAFQLRDDILGVFGDESTIGKPVGSDLIEGKKTLLVLKADNSYVNKKIGTKLNKTEISKIRKIIIASGSLTYSKNLITKLIESAKLDIQNSSIRKKEKDLLIYLADYLEKRTS